MKKISQSIKYLIAISIVFIIILSILIFKSLYEFHVTHNIHPDFNKVDIKNVDKLMIVAHPDDDILWGGAHLIEDDYLVVCVTCGVVRERVLEFNKVMHATNDKYIMLGYPDKTNGKRDNWNSVYKDITKDLKEIIELKDWDLIVTHNPEGEYGHQHHKMTNAIVTSVTTNKDKLYYFGHYYNKETIKSHYSELKPMSDDLLEKKKKYIWMYESQYFIRTMFNQMFPYENWLSYEEWNSEVNEEAN